MAYFHHPEYWHKRSAMPTLALLGHEDSGKEALFNALVDPLQDDMQSSSLQRVGRASCGKEVIRLIELPCIRALSAYTQEERVARRAVGTEKPLAVMALVNACSLGRQLYFVIQLMEMGVPVTVGLTMVEKAKKQGISIDVPLLEHRLGVPIMEVSVSQPESRKKYLNAALMLGRHHEGEPWDPLKFSYGPHLDGVLEKITSYLEEKRVSCDPYSPRWLALKLLEHDDEIIADLSRSNPGMMKHVREQLEAAESHLQAATGASSEAIVADYRYGYISSLLRGVLTHRNNDVRSMDFSERADTFLTHPVFGTLGMLFILYLMYRITFLVGNVPMEGVLKVFDWLHGVVDANMHNGVLKSLILSGIIDGMGGILCFVPLLFILFFLYAFLEDSGYLVRMSYMLNRFFRLFGLSGASIHSYLLGGGVAGGCAIPAIMAARPMRSYGEKLATVLSVPFLSCGAKLPIFLLLSGLFFPGYEAFSMLVLTALGWLIALAAARVLTFFFGQGKKTPFMMELPPYRIPTLKGMLIHACERTWMYLKYGLSVILALSIVVWASMTYPSLPEELVTEHTTMVSEIESQLAIPAISYRMRQNLRDAMRDEHIRFQEERMRFTFAGRLGTALEPVTRHAGFSWEANISLVAGAFAREVIVSSLGTAYSLYGREKLNPSLPEVLFLHKRWSTASAASFMVFVLLYSPCLMTLITIRRETRSLKWALFSFAFNTAVAMCMAIAVYHLFL